MFGYVKAEHPELKVQESQYYRGTYCGLCRAMGRCTGQCSRMALNYDFVFLALVRLSLNETDVCFAPKRCMAHILEKQSVMLPNAELDYAAAAAAILNERKNADDLADERGVKKLRAVLLAPFFRHSKKKAVKRFPSLALLDKQVQEALARLSEIEGEEQGSVDRPAEQFGILLGQLMSFELEGDRKKIAYEIGRHVGAWIYIADALDDMKEDQKKGRYNPFLKLWGGLPDEQQDYDHIRDALKNELFGASIALDLIPFERDPKSIKQHLLENILYLGLPAKADEILTGGCRKKAKKTREPKGISFS